MQSTQTKRKHPVAVIVMRILFTLFLAGTILFIFTNSSQIGAESGLRSASLTQWLNALMGRLGIGFAFTEGLVRKLAHLAEYALLGFWTMLTLRVYTRRILAFAAWPMLIGLLVAIADECYQLTVPGRAGLVTDVAIDFGGVVLGLCAALFIQLLVGAILLSLRQRKGGEA